jgi:hypothetical protein
MNTPMTITGAGAVTGYGWGTTPLWDGLLSGKPAAKLVDGFGPAGEDSAWLAGGRCRGSAQRKGNFGGGSRVSASTADFGARPVL